MKRKAIGIVTSTFPFGFGESFLHDEVEALTISGCDVTVFPAAARRAPNNHDDLRMGVIKFQPLSPLTLFRGMLGFFSNARSSLAALSLIFRSKNRMRTKLKNLVLFPTALAVAKAAHDLNLDHLHAYWLSGPATVAMVASSVSGISWSYSAHSWDIFMEDNLISEKSRAAGFGRTISALGRDRLLRYVDGDGSKVEVIHLGVKIPHGVPAARESKEFRLLCPAYFIPVKGHRYLLEALRHAVNSGVFCRCVLAGDGPLRAELEEMTRTLALGQVVSMPGMISHQELLTSLSEHAFDAVVLASVEIGTEFEGIPVSLMEAMAAGIPCIATRTGAISELIDDECGILVSQRDSHALGTAIIRLATDPGLRGKLAQRAIDRIDQQFNPTVAAHKLRSLMFPSSTSTATSA